MTDLARHTYDYPVDWNGGTLPAKTDPTQRLRDWVELFREVVKAAEFLSKTPFVPKEMLGKPADVAAAIMKGHELGMDPLDALANVYVVHGRVGFYAEFQRRRIIQAGHSFRVVESSDTRCIVEGIRREGGEPQRATFSADQARKAGLDLGKYPADKLIARATSRLCRQVFPDVLSGSLIAEDIIDGLIPAGDEPAAVVDELPARPGLQRRRQPAKPKAAATQPPTAPTPAADDDDLLDEIPATSAAETHPHGPDQTCAEYEDAKLADELTEDEHTPPPAKYTRRSQQTDCTLGEPQQPPLPINQPADNPEPPITGPQLKKLSILLAQQGFDDRASRHGFVSAAINRDITTAKELTRSEASHVIDTLENNPAQP